jgi:hypothetical protein
MGNSFLGMDEFYFCNRWQRCLSYYILMANSQRLKLLFIKHKTWQTLMVHKRICYTGTKSYNLSADEE